MTESLGPSRRTHYCGEICENLMGESVVVAGWCQRRRDLGKLIFIDLRDRTGIVQLAFGDDSEEALFEKAAAVKSEYVILAKGKVRERSSKNPHIPTGNVEIEVEDLKILSQSRTPPFDITDATNAGEDFRLKYRYLDLRRPALMKNLIFKSRAAQITRNFFEENGFFEIETPTLIRSTPEGARDYLVPSRLHPGEFYALPQSPQLYKQLLMVAGFDKYFQIARCFRDEDLRADRQPEFTQIDFEMSFVGESEIQTLTENFLSRLFKEMLGISLPLPFPQFTYREVMERFGTDKPDIRYGMELTDITDVFASSAFAPFAAAVQGGAIKCINIKGGAEKLSRKEIDRLCEYAKGCGAKGLYWLKYGAGISGSFIKHMTPAEMDAVTIKTGAKEGDALLIAAEKKPKDALSTLGLIRVLAAERAGVPKDGAGFLWVTEFPYFELNPETGAFAAAHHPFTAPLDECLPYLLTDKARVRARAYDLVLNGVELSSGSIRITDPKLQETIFGLLGLSEAESKEKFGFLTEAFGYGAPPHGGMALGLDRLVMQMLRLERPGEVASLRDVIAFPKAQNAKEPMTECPSPAGEDLLKELSITVTKAGK